MKGALLGLTLAGAVWLGGCAVGPDYHPPATAAPAAWAGATTNLSTNAATIVESGRADLAAWWEKFHDPQLTALVREALRTNLDLQIAVTRLREARAQRGIVASSWWPGAAASGSYAREGRGGGVKSKDNFAAGLDAAWELDIFGGTRRGVEAADAATQASLESLRDAQVSVAAEVALDYIQLRTAQEQIAIAEQNLQAQRRTADLTRRRLAAGFVSGLDLANANAQVATTESAIPALQTTAQESIYALSVLLARMPADLLPELSSAGDGPGDAAGGADRAAIGIVAAAAGHPAGGGAIARGDGADWGGEGGPVPEVFVDRIGELPERFAADVVRGGEPGMASGSVGDVADFSRRRDCVERAVAGGVAGRGVFELSQDGAGGVPGGGERAGGDGARVGPAQGAERRGDGEPEGGGPRDAALHAGGDGFSERAGGAAVVVRDGDGAGAKPADALGGLVSLYKALGGGWD